MCATGEASSIGPCGRGRTFWMVTSTPHFSQTMPLYFMRLYLPHKHRSPSPARKCGRQNRPSRSGLKVAVVDRLRLFDLAVTPAQDLLRAGQRNLDPVEGWDFLAGRKDVHQLLVHFDSLCEFASVFALPPSPSTGPGRRPSPGQPAPGLPKRWRPHTRLTVHQSTFRPSERISLTSTLKLSGIPASERVFAADDRFVDFGAPGDVVRLHGQDFLQTCRRRRRLPRPTLPFRRSADRRTAPCRPAAAG